MSEPVYQKDGELRIYNPKEMSLEEFMEKALSLAESGKRACLSDLIHSFEESADDREEKKARMDACRSVGFCVSDHDVSLSDLKVVLMKSSELLKLYRDFYWEIRKAKNLEEGQAIAARYQKEAEIKCHPHLNFEDFALKLSFFESETSHFARFESTTSHSFIETTIKAETETSAQTEIQRSTEEDKFAKIPKQHLLTRFQTKDELLNSNRDEEIRFENERVVTEIPDTFPFSYQMEMVLFGIFNLLTECGFNEVLVDRGHGYFPGSISKKIFLIPIRKQRDIFDAIGMKEKKPGVFANEQEVKKAFADLITYQHPIFHKRISGETTEDGKVIVYCVVSSEPLFRLFQFNRIFDEDHIQPAILERNPGGGWKLRGSLKKSLIMLNPTFWPEGIATRPKKLDSSLYKKIEESIKKLSRIEQKRYWRRDPVYFRFAYYLSKHGGKYEKNEDGRIFYKSEHEFWALLKRLGLWERYIKNEKDALTVLERTFEIYVDIGYVHNYEWQEAKRASKKKLVMRRNLERFPHLRQPNNRFSYSH